MLLQVGRQTPSRAGEPLPWYASPPPDTANFLGLAIRRYGKRSRPSNRYLRCDPQIPSFHPPPVHRRKRGGADRHPVFCPDRPCTSCATVTGDSDRSTSPCGASSASMIWGYELLPLGRGDGAGIQHYSQEGGFHGCCWLAMTASRSLPNSSSTVTVEFRRRASRRISDTGRPLRCGGRITATGRWSCSTTTRRTAALWQAPHEGRERVRLL